MDDGFDDGPDFEEAAEILKRRLSARELEVVLAVLEDSEVQDFIKFFD